MNHCNWITRNLVSWLNTVSSNEMLWWVVSDEMSRVQELTTSKMIQMYILYVIKRSLEFVAPNLCTFSMLFSNFNLLFLCFANICYCLKIFDYYFLEYGTNCENFHHILYTQKCSQVVSYITDSAHSCAVSALTMAKNSCNQSNVKWTHRRIQPNA